MGVIYVWTCMYLKMTFSLDSHKLSFSQKLTELSVLTAGLWLPLPPSLSLPFSFLQFVLFKQKVCHQFFLNFIFIICTNQNAKEFIRITWRLAPDGVRFSFLLFLHRIVNDCEEEEIFKEGSRFMLEIKQIKFLLE